MKAYFHNLNGSGIAEDTALRAGSKAMTRIAEDKRTINDKSPWTLAHMSEAELKAYRDNPEVPPSMKTKLDEAMKIKPTLRGGLKGVSKASGFIQRMMAENKKKHNGSYKPPTEPAAPGSTMKAWRAFDYKKLANSSQGGERPTDRAPYGASPFIEEHFKEMVGRGKETEAQKAYRAMKAAERSAKLLNTAKTLAAESKAQKKKSEVKPKELLLAPPPSPPRVPSSPPRAPSPPRAEPAPPVSPAPRPRSESPPPIAPVAAPPLHLHFGNSPELSEAEAKIRAQKAYQHFVEASESEPSEILVIKHGTPKPISGSEAEKNNRWRQWVRWMIADESTTKKPSGEYTNWVWVDVDDAEAFIDTELAKSPDAESTSMLKKSLKIAKDVKNERAGYEERWADWVGIVEEMFLGASEWIQTHNLNEVSTQTALLKASAERKKAAAERRPFGMPAAPLPVAETGSFFARKGSAPTDPKDKPLSPEMTPYKDEAMKKAFDIFKAGYEAVPLKILIPKSEPPVDENMPWTRKGMEKATDWFVDMDEFGEPWNWEWVNVDEAPRVINDLFETSADEMRASAARDKVDRNAEWVNVTLQSAQDALKGIKEGDTDEWFQWTSFIIRPIEAFAFAPFWKRNKMYNGPKSILQNPLRAQNLEKLSRK